MSKLIEKKEDKFHNKTELITKSVSLWSKISTGEQGEMLSLSKVQPNKIKGNFRYWSTPAGDSILLDLNYNGRDWMYFRQGDIVIRINDTKNIQLKPQGDDSDVSSNGNVVNCNEVLYYEVSKEDFKDICSAKTIEMQITGARTFVNGNADKLQTIARILYDNLYEPIYDTKELAEKMRSKWKSVLSMLFAFPAAIASGAGSGYAFYYLLFSSQPLSYDLSWIIQNFIFLVIFCVANYFLPYPKKMKWVSTGICIIVLLLVIHNCCKIY